MNRPQVELFEVFTDNGGEEYLSERFGEPIIYQFGLRAETGDYHKTMKTWFEGDECRARILIYRNTAPADDQIVVRQYLGDYCD